MQSSVNGGMPVHSAVTLQLLLTTMLLLHHADTRPFADCRSASTADNHQHSVLPIATSTVQKLCTQKLQHPLETLDDEATSKTATIQQVTIFVITVCK